MNDTVIVTVSGDRQEETFEADRHQPLGHLLSGWAARCSSLPPGQLTVVHDGDGRRLDPSLDLAGIGASYGTTLRLIGDAGPPLPDDEPPDPADAVAHPAVAAGCASAASEVAPASGACLPVGLPQQVGWFRRRTMALAASLSRTAPPPAESFALPDKPGPAARWRSSMAATDRLALLEEQVRAATITESVVIAVVSPKGGVGKTTITGLLASLLAELRRDPVLALDANADFGNLAARLCTPERRGMSAPNLWAWSREREVSPAALAQQLGQGPHGVRVLGSPAETGAMLAAADHGLYEGLLGWLRGFGGVIVADCGTGLLDPPTRAALEAADQIVLVTDSAADTARLVVEAGQHLASGRPCWLVANKVPGRGARVDLDAVRSALPGLAGCVVVSAVDLAENVLTPAFRWEGAPGPWRGPVRELAARLTQSWAPVEPSGAVRCLPST
jgi:MinD-like ATPase involved in chromosome partitioning or flagellar assembly